MIFMYPQTSLPILHTCDILVVGGSFSGIAAALQMAQAGRTVTLIESRTYMGREMTAKLRPWLPAHAIEGRSTLIQSCLSAGSTTPEATLNLDFVKLHLEGLLLEAGCRVLYATLPMQLLVENNRVDGVVVGNKMGRQIIRCHQLVDATETALIAHLAREPFADWPGNHGRCWLTIEFDQVAPSAPMTLTMPGHLGVVSDTVKVIPGHHGPRHRYLTCAFDIPLASYDSMSLTWREIIVRERAMGVIAHVMHHESAFNDAYLAALSPEVSGVYTPGLLASDHEGLDALRGNIRGVWYLNQAVSDRLSKSVDFQNPIASSMLGQRLGKHIIDQLADGPRELPSKQTPVPAETIPVLSKADVVVVGGGTSGATASIVAAREGLRTIVVDMNHGLGGTGTYGGVHSYWFGRRVGFARQLLEAVESFQVAIGHKPPQGFTLRWNIEAKAHVLARQASEHGVEMLLNTLFVSAIVEDAEVRGIVVATRTGPVTIFGTMTIDATGDGDVAVSAGADFVYGGERDHVTMWYSLAQFSRPGLTRNNFTSMVDVSNVADYTRAILSGRRRSRDGARQHDHGSYVAPRESRHIRGDVILTLTDQLRQRSWPDVVNIAFSNHDVKGHTTSDWLRMGLIPPNLEVEIPYRALLPAKLDQILVVGKALSATHDALPAIRMQPDLENLGGVAGLATALAIQTGVSLREIDIRALQQHLIRENVLPKDILNRELARVECDPRDLERLIEEMDANQPLSAYADMDFDEVYRDMVPIVELCCAGLDVIPLLKHAHDHYSGAKQRLLAQALAMVGSTHGNRSLILHINNELDRVKGLPELDSDVKYAQLPPDQGAMPQIVNWLYSLGMTPDKQAIHVWERVVERLSDAQRVDFEDGSKCLFYYVDAVCFGAERLGNSAAIPILKRLGDYEPLTGNRFSGAYEREYFPERLAYLELVIARALARCGSPFGFLVLIDYLNDTRALLAKHAQSELVDISGQDFGYNAAQWSDWLEQHGDSLPPVPVTRPTDAVVAWDCDVHRAF